MVVEQNRDGLLDMNGDMCGNLMISQQPKRDHLDAKARIIKNKGDALASRK